MSPDCRVFVDVSSGAPSHVLKNVTDMTGDFGDEGVVVIVASANDVNDFRRHLLKKPHGQHLNSSGQACFVWKNRARHARYRCAVMFRSGKVTTPPTPDREVHLQTYSFKDFQPGPPPACLQPMA
ncbi:hypothetical protein J6590_013469 [Homalodisca vitripennis]|nr:hypothetical protein J6590_013469 [Homalodisca vitripennis]